MVEQQPYRPIEEIKVEAATILFKALEGTAYESEGLYYTAEQKRIILAAAEAYGLNTESITDKIRSTSAVYAINQEFIDAYKKAYRAKERAAAKGQPAMPRKPRPAKPTPAAEPAEPEPEPLEAEAPADLEPITEAATELQPATIPAQKQIKSPQAAADRKPQQDQPQNLEAHKTALIEHIANILNGQIRAGFYADLEKITKSTADNLNQQDAEILTLCLKVKAAEIEQTKTPEPEPLEAEALAIRDGDKIIDGNTGEILTGAKAEAVRQELEAAKRENIIARAAAIPPHIRHVAIRDFRTMTSPDYISTNPAEARYFINTRNDDDLARRIRAETAGYLINNKMETRRGSEEPRPYWLYWNGTAYAPDDERINQAIINAINTMFEEHSYLSAKGADPKLLGQFLTFINKSKNDRSISAALNRLKKFPGVSIDLDIAADHNLLSLENIIFDTATGEIIPKEKTERIEELKAKYPYHYIKGRRYIPGARPEKYLKMVYTFYYDNQDPELTDAERDRRATEAAAWEIRTGGYDLIAGNPEGLLRAYIGDGKGGKTTLIRTRGKTLTAEEYAEPNIKEIQSGARGGPKDTLTTGTPKRLLFFDEGSGDDTKGGELDANLLKRLTTAKNTAEFRGMYAYSKVLPVNCKLILSMNEPPHFDKGIDTGLSRRLVIIPSNHIFTEAERINNYDDLIISEEADAIISLMIDECRAYLNELRNGRPGLLPIPAYWKEYKAQILGGSVYTAFLIDNYKPITDISEKTPENKIYRDELIGQLIAYARANHCIDDLGHLIDTEETGEAAGNEWATTRTIKTLNKSSAGKFRAALLELGYGDFKATHHPRPYIYAKYKLPDTNGNGNKKTSWF